MKRFSLIFACVLCMVLLGSAPGAAKEKQFTGSFSGWSLESPDHDEEGQPRSHASATGQTTLAGGAYTVGALNQLLPYDGSSVCDLE